MLAPGQTLGRYRIDGMLGQGAMGTVYRAWDPTLARAVALKVLATGADALLPDAEGRARFFREARAAAGLAHPNVVTILDVGEIDGEAYLAMELVAGASLRALVGDARVPLGARIAWLADVARALAIAHERGLVHRDVKPENVLVAASGTAKLADFGIVKRLPDAAAPLSFRTRTGVLMGTPEYMAPEQWTGAEVDGRVDQYAWGLVAYELLTGRSTPLGKPPPLASVLPELPGAVSAAVMRALEHERTARFASMSEAADALAPFAGSEEERASAAALGVRAQEIGSAPTVAARGANTQGHATDDPTSAPTVEWSPPPPAPQRTTRRGPRTRSGSRAIVFGAAVFGTLVVAGAGLAAVALWLPFGAPLSQPGAPDAPLAAAATASSAASAASEADAGAAADTPPAASSALSSARAPSHHHAPAAFLDPGSLGCYSAADASEIQAVFSSRARALADCLGRPARDERFLTQLRVVVTVVDGIPMRVELAHVTPGARESMVTCLEAVVRTMRFPLQSSACGGARFQVTLRSACDCAHHDDAICPPNTADCPR